MIRKSRTTALQFGAVALLLFALLFVDGMWRTSPGFTGSILREITAVCRDAATQWMLVFCLACYFVMLLFLERRTDSTPAPPSRTFLRRNRFNPNLWLATFVGLVLLRYVLAYGASVKSTQVPVLLAGIVFGKGILVWARWQNDKIERRMVWLMGLLVCLFAGGALWQPEATRQFQYHGVQRWSGVWDNPNLYGLLMAVGVVLSGGLLIQISTSNIRWRKMLCAILCLLAAMVMGYGLFRSYSRGAWLGAICGLAYLVARSNIVEPARLSYSSCLSWLNRNRLPLSAIMLSLVVLLFWQCRFSEWPPAQRVYSIANTADFSWRNRVAAWEGATRMMIDRPLAGFGWGQAETDYNKKYLPSKLEEGAAIEMNDYLMLGISAGAPALICFVVYLALSFRRKPAGSNPSLNVHHPPFSIFTACRAGAIVLLVGFWFDGGLFKLSVGPIFWMLMELSRLGSPAREEMASLTSKSETLKLETGNHPESPHVICYSKKEIWLRRGAWVLAAAAVFQTIVYLGTPFLPVSHGTLAVARKSLISPKTTADFDFLATNSVWGGKKLKVLLEHVGLASYNRALLNWQLDDNMYRDFVLSPVITGKPDEQLNWRRSLWEEFYPRIRRQSSPADAANVVLRHLRERVTISTIENVPHDVPDIWARRITDAAGFDIVYIAALRSVGIAARLNDRGQVELFTDGKWQPALGLNAGDLPKADKK